MPKIRTAIGAVAVLCAVVVAVPSAAVPSEIPVADSAAELPTDGADPVGVTIAQHPAVPIYQAPPGEIAGNAFADAFDARDADGAPTREVLMSWQRNEDVAAADSQRTQVFSFDSGYTFPSGHTPGISGFFRKLRDGNLFGVEFIPAKVIDSHRVQLQQRRSSDGGRSWRDEHATFTTDKTLDPARFNRGIRVHRDILEDAQGNLLLTYYTANLGESAGSTELAISKDNGRSWNRLSTIFPPQGTRSFNEAGVSWASNGDLVAVVRSHLGSALSRLYTARSSDQGRTWSTAVPVAITTASGDPAPTTGVMPVLRLLPNGIMTLTFGRPDNWLAISADGSGRSFQQAQTTYQNYPDQDTGAFQRSHGSSGNGSHAVVGANRILEVGDNCAPSWGCPATDAGFQIDNKYRVWTKFIDVLSPGVGKIDLLGRYRAGTVSIQTNMTAKQHKLPEMGPIGAIDGSTDWASSAVRKGGPGDGSFTLTLDRTYTLTKVGLSLHPGLPSAAVVQTSVDGRVWTPVTETGTLRSRALTYFPIHDVPAKYLRVTVNEKNRDRAGAAFLNEIELYSTVDSFENDAVETVPRGYVNAIGATVTDVDTNGDGHAMRLADSWNDKIASATRRSAPAAKQDLSFRMDSIGYARGFVFITNGTIADGSTVPAYQLSVMADGSIASYNGVSKAWTKLTAPGAAPQKIWHSISVSATLTGAQIRLDGKDVGSAPPTTAGVTALTGHTFTSAGTTSSYDNFVIDDVEQVSPR